MPKIRRKGVQSIRKQLNEGLGVSSDNGNDAEKFAAHLAKMDSNVFSGVAINPNSLSKTTTVPMDAKSVITAGGKDFDTRSKITSRSFKGLGIKKKDKERIRTAAMMEQIKQRADRVQQQKDRTEREGIELTGDMAPMDDALSTLALLMKKTNTKTEVNTNKPKKAPTEKQRMKQSLSDIEAFHQIRKDQTFKKKPFSTIKEHLKNKLILEVMEDEDVKDQTNVQNGAKVKRRQRGGRKR